MACGRSQEVCRSSGVHIMEKFDWLDSGNYAEFPKDYDGEVYLTPEWVRHPERMPPEKLERMVRVLKEWLK